MKRYFVETSIIISYLRAEKAAVALIDNLDGELTSSHICLAELYEGVARVKEKGKAEQGILDFFHGLDTIYGLDEAIAKEFGRIRTTLKKLGTVIEDIDILIAATCLVYDATLLTANVKHFSRVAGLVLLS